MGHSNHLQVLQLFAINQAIFLLISIICSTYVSSFFMSLACITQFLVIIGQNNLPNIVPVATGIVVGNAGVVYTTVTGAGVVTPRQI